MAENGTTDRGNAERIATWESWADDDDHGKEEFCSLAIVMPVCLAGMMFFWSATCYREIRNIVALYDAIVVKVQTTSSYRGMVETTDEGEIIIHGMTRGLKFFVIVFVVLPKMIIALVLLWMGALWLVAACDIDDLVMNAIAIEFIMLTDDLFFEALASRVMQRDVEMASIKIRRKFRRGQLLIQHFSAFTGFILASIHSAMGVYVYPKSLADGWATTIPEKSSSETLDDMMNICKAEGRFEWAR